MTKVVWFARANLRPSVGYRMSPVSRQGWLVALGFAAVMIVGALVFVGLMLLGAILAAVVEYVLVAVVAGGSFIWAAVTHSDNTRTVADYRQIQGEQGGRT